jgi:hypothetical protein
MIATQKAGDDPRLRLELGSSEHKQPETLPRFFSYVPRQSSRLWRTAGKKLTLLVVTKADLWQGALQLHTAWNHRPPSRRTPAVIRC